MFQELANANIEDLKAAGTEEDPDVVPALREDDRRRLPQVRLRGRDRPLVGVRRGADRAADRAARRRAARATTVTFHDPCYLGRYARQRSTSRARCSSASAPTSASRSATARTRTAAAPAAACCSPTRKRSRASRISDVRFKQLQDTGRQDGRDRVPVLLDHAEGRAGQRAGADVQFVDLMTFVNGRLQNAGSREPTRDVARRRGRSGSRRRSSPCRLPADRGARRRRCAGGPKGCEHSRRDRASGRQPIMAFWHGRILPATYYFRRRGIVVITSENFDGEWIAGIIERFGYGTARGSTSRGARQGAAAADARHGGGEAGRRSRSTARAVRRSVAQPGAVWLAKATGNPVLPFHLEANRHWTLEQLGPHADSEAVRDRGDRHRRAVLRAGRRGRDGD